MNNRDRHVDEFLILNAGHHHFVQFAIHEDHVCGEVVGNHYLEEWNRFDDDQVRLLDVLGWTAPDEEATDDGHHAYNFWREWMGASTAEIVRDVTQALAAVLLPDEGVFVRLKHGSFVEDLDGWVDQIPA